MSREWEGESGSWRGASRGSVSARGFACFPLTHGSVGDAGQRGAAPGRAPDGDADAGDGGHGGGEQAEERGSDAECVGQGRRATSCTGGVFVSHADAARLLS